jgi:hypothetical protein
MDRSYRQLVPAGWDAGPRLTRRPGQAEGRRGVGSRTCGGTSPDNVTAGRLGLEHPRAGGCYGTSRKNSRSMAGRLLLSEVTVRVPRALL